MKQIISVAGTVGSGKSTICNLLAEKLGYKCYVLGDVMRKLANQNNMDIVEFNNYIKDKKEFDNIVDDMLIQIANNENQVIFSSRTAWHFLPDSFKIYLTVSNEEAANRIYNDKERIFEKTYANVNEAIENVRKRNEMETQRYKEVYGIDVLNKNNYDLYIDTTNMSVEEVMRSIINAYEIWLKGKM